MKHPPTKANQTVDSSMPAFRNDCSHGKHKTGPTPNPNDQSSGVIDVNHRFWAPFMANHSGAGSSWTSERAINWMHANNISSTILSAPANMLNGLSASAVVHLSMHSNDYAAGLAERFPGVFDYLATLPLPFIDDSANEIDRAFNQLGTTGIAWPANINGLFPGDDRFIPLLKKLDERSANVLVLPNSHPCSVNLNLTLPDEFIEHPCDVSRAAISLILNGKLEEYPNIRWILAEGGGFLPYIAWRLSLANIMPELTTQAPQGILHYIRRFWFDTSFSHNPVITAVLQELVGPDKILFGSGGPSLHKNWAQKSPELDSWSIQFQNDIGRNNAATIFPSLRKPTDMPAQIPRYPPQSLGLKLTSRTLNPIKVLAQRARK